MTAKRAYVLEPYLPNGGTYMAYHLARILHRDFGLEAIAVSDSATTARHGVYLYDIEYPSVTIGQMIADIRDEDVLLANPSFSWHGLGAKARGTKVMYIQGFNTFDLLDCRFDHYVSVSTFVQSFIRNVYAIDTEVIPAFIDVSPDVPRKPWAERPCDSFFVWTKGRSPLTHSLHERLQRVLPEHRLEPTLTTRVPHREVLRMLGERRFFVTLSAAEGFGLPALEAMAMGATVVGFDGFGGREYMRPGTNCLVRPFPDVDGVADAIRLFSSDPRRAESIAEAGRETAAERRFTYEAFRAAWQRQFQRILGHS
jgi:hypothetical protein